MSTKILLILNLIFLFLIVDSAQSQMYWNQAATFGSSSQYIVVENSSSLNITGSFTLEAWINPSRLTGTSKGIFSKGNLLGSSLRYGMRLLTSGKLQVLTNGTPRLVSKTAVQVNRWTHVACIYDSANAQFAFYINGLFDTNAVVGGAAPVSNTDSLYIGISGATTPFAGSIDDVRIWNTKLIAMNIPMLKRTPLGIASQSLFNNLVLSMTMQNNTASGTFFSTKDFSDKGNDGKPAGVTPLDLRDVPLNHLQMNDCLDFSVSSGYLSSADNSALNPTSKMTIECWIFPKSINGIIVYKGPYLSFVPEYALRIESGKLTAYINNLQILSNDTVKLQRWNHVAFTYFGTTGRYEFFLNGKPGTVGNISPANINDGMDSLFVGAAPAVAAFSGYMDELRITHDLKSINDINNSMFESQNESNDNDAVLNAVYNFDGLTWGSTSSSPRLNLRAGSFTFNGFMSGSIQSPVNGYSNHDFQKGFYLNMPNKRIPSAGATGNSKDTIKVPLNESISDVNIFVALNHKREDHLRLTLTNPLGSSVEFFSNHFLKDSIGNVVTVFDSDADSSLASDRYISFSPKIKPMFDIDAIYSGTNTNGNWVLTVNDDAGPDTGIVIAWGLQFNNKTDVPLLLNCTSLIEGFYRPATNVMIADTVRYLLRSAIFPYPVVDSSKALVSSAGNSQSSFSKALVGTNYFLEIRHRNSIATWSSSVIQFPQFNKSSTYDFTDLASKAFGNNMKQVDTSPIKFGIFGGDVNQDGSVELTDIVNIFNDATGFATGYVVTDVNADDFVDLTDITLTFNNSNEFVTVISP